MPIVVPPPISESPISLYFTWQQFVNRFGLTNIIKVSNKDTTMQGPTNAQPIPNGQPNWYAVQDAFNYATDKIHDILQGGILKIPLDFTNNAGVIPIRVGRWAMIIAYCDLLNMRNPDKIPAFQRGKIHSSLATYASELDEVLCDIAQHRDGTWRQMPEAFHLSGIDASTVSVQSVRQSMGFVRYVGGAFVFSWNQP